MCSRPLTDSKVISALLTPQPGKEGELAQTLEALAGEIQAEPACLECVIGREWTGGPRFLLFMAWRDQGALEACLASESFRILLGATRVLTHPAGLTFLSAPSGYLPSATPERPVARPRSRALRGSA